MSKYELKVVSDQQELARTAAAHFVERSRDAVERTNGCAVALAGGSTPKRLYELLANPREPFRDQIPWKKLFFFFGDERHVPPDHPESNYRMAYEAMLAHVPVKRTQILRMAGEKSNAAEAAQEYEDILDELYGVNTPDLDLILLGLGEDGHTASLFPHSPALKETERLVAAPWVEKLNCYRITLTLPVLNNGVSVMFLVSGSGKAAILKEVLETESDAERYPAQAISPENGKLIWLVDEAAASLLTK
jgi:6-phosphogluconolactonase